MIKLKKDSRVFALWTLIILGTGYSCVSGKLDWKVAGGLLVALGLPSVLCEKKEIEK